MMKKIFFIFLHFFSNKFFLVSILVTLLSGTRHQTNQSLSEKIVKRMEKLFPEAEKGLISASILLSDVYTEKKGTIPNHFCNEFETLKKGFVKTQDTFKMFVKM